MTRALPVCLARSPVLSDDLSLMTTMSHRGLAIASESKTGIMEADSLNAGTMMSVRGIEFPVLSMETFFVRCMEEVFDRIVRSNVFR